MAVADRTLQILPGGQSSAPFTYTIPASTSFGLIAVRATFDGTAAAGAYLPCVQIVSDAGEIMAQTIGSSVAAGGSADATFFPWVKTAASTVTGGISYENLILSIGVDAFYKLDETSGSTANDSSGNGHHITATGTTPAWNQIIGPTGTAAPLFAAGQSFGGAGAVTTYTPNLAGDFTIAGWINTLSPSGGQSDLVAIQGNPFGGGTTGWGLGVSGPAAAPNHHPFALVGTGASRHLVDADNAITYSTWHHEAVVHEGTVWTLYVDGVAQSTPYNGAYGSALSQLQVGQSTGTGLYLQYVTLFARALNATAIAALAGTL